MQTKSLFMKEKVIHKDAIGSVQEKSNAAQIREYSEEALKQLKKITPYRWMLCKNIYDVETITGDAYDSNYLNQDNFDLDKFIKSLDNVVNNLKIRVENYENVGLHPLDIWKTSASIRVYAEGSYERVNKLSAHPWERHKCLRQIGYIRDEAIKAVNEGENFALKEVEGVLDDIVKRFEKKYDKTFRKDFQTNRVERRIEFKNLPVNKTKSDFEPRTI